MAWYVVLLSNVNATTIGDVHAQVAQFADAAAYTQTTGADPASVLPAGWQTAAGFPTQARAQAVASRYNALPAGQRSAGGKPLAPSVIPPLIKNPLSNLFNLTGGPFSQNFWIRAAEVVLGLGLIIVGLAHIAPGSAVADIARKAKLL
jgi:hypothetical protein